MPLAAMAILCLQPNQGVRRTKSEGSSIRILALVVVSIMAGCRQEVRSQHSTDSQTTIAGTSSNLDSQATIVAATSTPAVAPTSVASDDTAPSVHFSSP